MVPSLGDVGNWSEDVDPWTVVTLLKTLGEAGKITSSDGGVPARGADGTGLIGADGERLPALPPARGAEGLGMMGREGDVRA